jgi:hypothetical protein
MTGITMFPGRALIDARRAPYLGLEARRTPGAPFHGSGVPAAGLARDSAPHFIRTRVRTNPVVGVDGTSGLHAWSPPA